MYAGVGMGVILTNQFFHNPSTFIGRILLSMVHFCIVSDVFFDFSVNVIPCFYNVESFVIVFRYQILSFTNANP